MGDPVVTERVQRFLSTNPNLERAPDVPSRAEFEVIASS
jgi:hypothetical protein